MKKVPRKFWFRLHSWVGLKLSIMLFFILATGTLAVFAHEIDWLLTSGMRVAVEDERASWGEQLDAIRTGYPAWTPGNFFAPVDAWFAAEMVMQTPEGELRRVYVNPYTAKVTGDADWFNAHRFFREIHRHLFMPVDIGVPIVSVFALAMFVTLLSSFWVYKKWWRGFLSWPRRDRSRRFWGDLHRLAGVWTMWFVLLMAVTGSWYLVESLGGNAPPAATLPRGEPGTQAPRITGAELDRMIAHAKATWPELDIEQLRFPAHAGQPLVVMGEADPWLVRVRANVIAFDPVTGEEIHRHNGSELNLHQRISEAADPLHFGYFGGLPTKILWFFFGALLTMLSATGIYLYGIRTATDSPARSRRRRKDELPAGRRWHKAWRDIGHWRWPALLLLVICLALLPQAMQR
ncbi:MAG TPA: PepSY-associated TM helix domain-containing protein [Gammaproteobacteria bacterium]